ncbi:MAG: C10 family peptidase [Bacteroidales bacterium]|nr:C10 family peptidase [Bacteroidales bacterium]
MTKENAAKVATNFLSGVVMSDGLTRAAMISETFNIQKEGATVLYVFNFEKGGYVIVSAEDHFTPILGYSPDGYYEEGNMPDAFKDLLVEFSDMITFIQERNIAAQPEYTEKWERYASDNPMDRGITEVKVAPMTALWNQDYPYNYYAPTADGGPGGRAYAGCVATAMSMVMYYWRWPWQGTGTKTYKPSKCAHGTDFEPIGANFEDTYYDYNGMFGTPEINANNYLYEPIALLQYHAGIAVSMQYCKDGSGAQSAAVPSAIKNYFKYDQSAQFVQKGNATTAQWAARLKEQLDAGQPTYNSGYSYKDGSGHAFCCDGYDSNDMFHYNFGWSGSANGYFVADKPDEFTTSGGAVVNFIPDRSKGYPVDCNGSWTLPYLKGMLTDGSEPIANYKKGVTATWLFDPESTGTEVESFTFTCNKIDLASGDYLRIYDGADESAPLLGEYSGNEPFAAVKTTSGKILVKFTSSALSATGKGFLITYTATEKQHCKDDIELYDAAGIISDGSPEGVNYANGASCKWLITPDGITDPDTEITLEFLRLDTEEGKDEIKFYNNVNAVPLGTFSGTPDILPKVVAKAPKGVTVIFSSNAFINGKGFEIKYSTNPVSIREVENINDLSVYPNPASDKLNIKFNTATADDFNITVYNVTGQAVYKETLNNFIGSYYNEISVNDFAQGVYLMQVKSSQGAATRKIVIK